MSDRTVEQHIAKDKEILDNASTSPQQRRHIEGELQELEIYATTVSYTHLTLPTICSV